MATKVLSDLPTAGFSPASKPQRSAPTVHYASHKRKRKVGDTLVYYSVFITLFALALPVVAGLKMAGRPVEGGIIQASKRAADGPAGYAVQC